MVMRQIAAVSGGSSGIGQAVVAGLVEDGYRVAFSGRNYSKIQALMSEINRHKVGVTGVVSDARDEGHASGLFALAQRTFSAWPNVYVACAGQGFPGTLLRSSDIEWEAFVRLNLLGVMHQMREAAQMFSSNTERPCDLVVIGAASARSLPEIDPVFASIKAALHALVESLRREVCPHGIRVTLIEPGFVVSGFQKAAGYDPKWFTQIERDHGRLLQPRDVAKVVRFIIQQPLHVHIDDVRIRPTGQPI